jgi:hypothetical protein
LLFLCRGCIVYGLRATVLEVSKLDSDEDSKRQTESEGEVTGGDTAHAAIRCHAGNRCRVSARDKEADEEEEEEERGHGGRSPTSIVGGAPDTVFVALLASAIGARVAVLSRRRRTFECDNFQRLAFCTAMLRRHGPGGSSMLPGEWGSASWRRRGRHTSHMDAYTHPHGKPRPWPSDSSASGKFSPDGSACCISSSFGFHLTGSYRGPSAQRHAATSSHTETVDHASLSQVILHMAPHLQMLIPVVNSSENL